MSSDWYGMLSLMSCCVAHTVECSTALMQISRNCGIWCSLLETQPSHHDQQADVDVGLNCLPLEQAYQSDRMVLVNEALEAPP